MKLTDRYDRWVVVRDGDEWIAFPPISVDAYRSAHGHVEHFATHAEAIAHAQRKARSS